MHQKIAHLSIHYLGLGAFLLSCWGGGRALERWLPSGADEDRALDRTLASVFGAGLWICALQWLALAGALRPGWILALLAAAGAFAIFGLRPAVRADALDLPALRVRPVGGCEQFGVLVLVMLVIPTLVAPLKPPLAWDELMYHLPHARQWAENSALEVNEWLRYPWFPYNYNLLFAGALTLGSDVAPHLLHAAAGWATALLIYLGGRRYGGHAIGCIATAIWLVIAAGQFDTAYIDMGVTVFVFSASLALLRWIEAPERRVWLGLAAFLLGVAAGSKYQVLGLVPAFAALLAMRDRKIPTLALAVGCFLVPCAYWYVRNAVSTGDPFDPVGGKFFGYFDWNPQDYQAQFEDLDSRSGWPSWLIAPALVSPLLSNCIRSEALRSAMGLGACGILVWWLTAAYPRYLLPSYPMLALLAAFGWRKIDSLVLEGLVRAGIGRSAGGGTLLENRALQAFIVVLLAVGSGIHIHKDWSRVVASPAAREALLERKVAGYKVLSYLRSERLGKTYQFGLEGSIYYGPAPIWGDIFGPWRYRDFQSLAPPELASKLAGQGFEFMVVNSLRFPQIDAGAEFSRHFEEVYQADGVILYRIVGTEAL